MYRYDEFDQKFVEERVAQFTDQVRRRVEGSISEDEFKPLRLKNGVYLQLHAYMLRVAIPYGTLNSKQMYKLAEIADRYDRGYGHFTTRQNIQFNWVQLKDIPEVLAELATVQMHAIQTSGNCIRNITTDAWAGVAVDELMDSRVLAEQLRQWSSLQPEYEYLPRKFKIAVNAAKQDRAATKFHDLAIELKEVNGEIKAKFWVGGGLGRTPKIAKEVLDNIALEDVLDYLDALMRVYNLNGRRDNKYKARIKILVEDMGAEAFRAAVEAEYQRSTKTNRQFSDKEYQRIKRYFTNELANSVEQSPLTLSQDSEYRKWLSRNVVAHKVKGYRIVNIALKNDGAIPGDATSDEMRAIADIAQKYANDEIRITHRQNLVLPNVAVADLYKLYMALKDIDLVSANHGHVGDMICCPGLDYCALATARSIPVAQQLSLTLSKKSDDIGPITINQSGCINACGHHHVGNIGILGLERSGEEYYQITLGGDSGNDAAIGSILGPGFSKDRIVPAIEQIIDTYLNIREGEEQFIDTFKRVGAEPFKEALYVDA